MPSRTLSIVQQGYGVSRTLVAQLYLSDTGHKAHKRDLMFGIRHIFLMARNHRRARPLTPRAEDGAK
jgi:hypothetical protein